MKQVPDDPLFADEIIRALDTKIFGRAPVLCYESLDSTNTACFRLGEEGLAEGALVLAEYQKKGRGRMGRHWASPKGKNILLSVLLRPVLPPAEVSKITLLVAVSVAKTLDRAYSVKTGIKWPNDILYRERKLCGILTEMAAESDRVNFAVAGVGLNVNADA